MAKQQDHQPQDSAMKQAAQQRAFQNGKSTGPDIQAQPYYTEGVQNYNQQDSDQFVNGVYISDYVNVEKDGRVTHDKGPTFKELKQKAEQGDNKPRIVAKKMWKNAIAEVKLDDGRVMDIDTAVEFAEEFGIANVNVGRTRSGRKILRANPTDDPSKALRNLPTYE